MPLSDYLPSWVSAEMETIIFIIAIIAITLILSKIVDSILKRKFQPLFQKIGINESDFELVRHVALAFVYIAGIIAIINNIPSLKQPFSLIFSNVGVGNVANLVLVIVIIMATIIISKTVDKLLRAYFKVASRKMVIDETVYGLVRRIIVAFVYLIGLILIILSVPALRNLSLALFAGAGFAGIVIGMAAQSTLSNIIAGIALATFRPFRVGDIVTIHQEYGKITDITLGYTEVTTWDNRRLNIPNHIISDEAIINWSIEDPTVTWPIDVGISYDSDIDLARSIMMDEARKHRNVMPLEEIRRYRPTITKEDEIYVYVTELGDFAVNLRLYIWVRDRSIAYGTGCELRESIKKRFDAEGIEIPFPYRTIVYKKDLMESS